MVKKQSHHTGAKLMLGVAAASAAAYLLFGPNGNKNRKMVKSWAVKMKGDVLEELETVQEVTEPMYHAIVDKVSEKYAQMKNIDTSELTAAVEDLRKHWKGMMKQASPARRAAKKVAQVVKSAVKKSPKKVR